MQKHRLLIEYVYEFWVIEVTYLDPLTEIMRIVSK
jgi:hypothetical protein